MKKIALLIFILSLCSISVIASLYSEKIPDPSRFESITPIWSALLEKPSGDQMITALIRFEWLDYQGRTSKVEMFYLNDSGARYISDGGSVAYSEIYQFSCDPDYDDCVSACSDEPCIDQCALNFHCETQSTCEITGPDGTCGVKSATASFGNNELLLNFDPGGTGELDSSTYNGEQLVLLNQNGALTKGVFS